MKQDFARRHVAPLGRIILNSSQPVFGLTQPRLELTIYRSSWYWFKETSNMLLWYGNTCCNKTVQCSQYSTQHDNHRIWGVRIMVFNATISNISVLTWQQVLLVEETGVLGEHHRPTASYWQTFSHNVVSSTPRY